MSYEFRIGWRYLYRGAGTRRSAIGFGLSALCGILGAILFFASDGSSGIGVFTLTGGMLGAVFFGLLYFFSVFTTVSVLGVVLGVAALTTVLAVTTGFQKSFREKVLGVNAHVIIMKNTQDFKEYRDVEEVAWDIDPDVTAVHHFIFVEMQVTNGKGAVSGSILKGVDPETMSSVLDLYKHMVEGKVESLGVRPKKGALPNIILGQVLSEKLKVGIGDEVTVVVPLSNIDRESMSISEDGPKSKKFRVSGIFYSGFDEYDRRLMYINIEDHRDLLGWGDQVMGIELKVRDVERASDIAKKLDEALGGSPYVVQDWRELNKNLFTALTLQKIALLIILTLIIIVATFNMVAALTMMVIDKTREIAILKSMGATSLGIARMFQIVGICIGGIGTICGIGIGLVLCEVISSYNYKLDPKVYLIDSLPISVDVSEVVLIGVITMVISAVATLFPSGKASSLRPVDGLRYD